MITANIKDRVVMSAQQTAGGGGTSNYEELENLPSVNGHEVIGEKTGHDYGLANLDDIPAVPVYNLNVTKLFENNTGSPITNISLNDSINNYTLILISGICDSDGRSYRMTACYTPNELSAGLSGTLLRWAPSNEFLNFDVTDNEHINVFQYNKLYINVIYGIKLGVIE